MGEDPRTDRRLAMMPKLSSLSAVELSTADDSTRTSPKTLEKLDIDTDGPVYCLADNVDFDLGDGCDAEAFSRVDDSGAISCGDAAGDGAHVVWQESLTGNHEIIAFTPPTGMTASPISADERQ